MGDGNIPGGLSREDARAAFADAINNITGVNTDCGDDDQVDASSKYSGFTSLESNMNSSGDCLSRTI
jgi:hypothetical protein